MQPLNWGLGGLKVHCSKWEDFFLCDRWAFRETPKIKEMDNYYIRNCIKMIEDKRAKICMVPTLAKAYKDRFELELLRREKSRWRN